MQVPPTSNSAVYCDSSSTSISPPFGYKDVAYSVFGSVELERGNGSLRHREFYSFVCSREMGTHQRSGRGIRMYKSHISITWALQQQLHSCEASSVFHKSFQPVNSRLVRHSSSLFFSGGFNSSFSVLIVFFYLDKVFSLLVHLSPFYHSGVLKTSQEILLCSN